MFCLIHANCDHAFKAAGGYNIWIGVNDADVEGTYVADGTGDEIDWTNWQTGTDEPPSGTDDRDCVKFNMKSKFWGTDKMYAWGDVKCSCGCTNGFVCEFELDSDSFISYSSACTECISA